MSAPAAMAMGPGVAISKWRKGGVMASSFRASEKKAKTSGR